jgi:hypothetical protein
MISGYVQLKHCQNHPAVEWFSICCCYNPPCSPRRLPPSVAPHTAAAISSSNSKALLLDIAEFIVHFSCLPPSPRFQRQASIDSSFLFL